MMTSLSKTQRRLERWRSQHKKKSRLPVSLKSEAVGLLEQYSPREIAKALGISTGLFQKWQRIADAHRCDKVHRRPNGGRSKPAFIDVTAATSFSVPAQAMLTIEIPGRGTIKLSGDLSEAAVRAAVITALTPAPSMAMGKEGLI